MSDVTEPGTRLTVAFDGGPLLGTLTGVGAAVAEMERALRARSDIALRPYALSFRGELLPGMTRLPLPAAIAQRMWSRSDWPRLDRWLRPAQVVHGTNYVVGPSRLPRVVSVYDCWFLRNPGQASADVVRAGQVLRRAVANGATVHASSQATAVEAGELLGARRVEVIPLAALPISGSTGDVQAGSLGAPLDRLRGVSFVLALGTLERRKNVPALIAAFGQIADAEPDLHLVLAGADGDDVPAIDAASAALSIGARNRISRLGRVDSAQKHWLLSNARALAYPSLDEGFGFPLLEAMQYDVPVLASTRGSIPEVAGDGAVLVDADDIADLASGLQRIVGDDRLRATLTTAGRARVSAFSWTDTAAKLAELYHRLAHEGA